MLKALTNFTAHLTDETEVKHLMSFREGDLICDPKVARHLLSMNCPVTVVSDMTTVVCSRCGTIFDSSQYPQDATITLTNAAISIDVHMFSFNAGEIIHHDWIREALKSAGIPLKVTTVTQCPNENCHHVFVP